MSSRQDLRERIDYWDRKEDNPESYVQFHKEQRENGSKTCFSDDDISGFRVKKEAYTHIDRYQGFVDQIGEYIDGSVVLEEDGFKILDIGSSDGRAVRGLKERLKDDLDYDNNEIEEYVKTYELDLSKELLKSGKKLDTVENPIQGTVEAIPFKNNSFDVVICQNLLDYFDEDEIREINTEADQFLKDSGRKFIS